MINIKDLDNVIAIPSYKRNNAILKYTLNVLKDYQVNPKIIYIFVANKTEFKIYQESLPEIYHKNLIIGK